MDANFRLKNQLVSSFSSDPGLGIGMAYIMPCEGYDSYMKSQASNADVSFSLSRLFKALTTTQISTCVGFQALAKVNSKFSKGLRFRGVGAVSCARSEMVLLTCRRVRGTSRYLSASSSS